MKFKMIIIIYFVTSFILYSQQNPKIPKPEIFMLAENMPENQTIIFKLLKKSLTYDHDGNYNN